MAVSALPLSLLARYSFLAAPHTSRYVTQLVTRRKAESVTLRLFFYHRFFSPFRSLPYSCLRTVSFTRDFFRTGSRCFTFPPLLDFPPGSCVRSSFFENSGERMAAAIRRRRRRRRRRRSTSRRCIPECDWPRWRSLRAYLSPGSLVLHLLVFSGLGLVKGCPP